MNEIVPNDQNNPLWMALVPRPIEKKALIIAIALPLIPVAVAILMQRPAMRQAIQMRFFHTSKVVSQHMADFFQIMATKSAQEYQKAQM